MVNCLSLRNQPSKRDFNIIHLKDNPKLHNAIDIIRENMISFDFNLDHSCNIYGSVPIFLFQKFQIFKLRLRSHTCEPWKKSKSSIFVCLFYHVSHLYRTNLQYEIARTSMYHTDNSHIQVSHLDSLAE